MRTSFPNHAQLCHVWAAGAQSTGRAGNMSFDDGVLYSYGTPVARIVTDSTGARVALFTSADYSVSTGKQTSRAWRAWRGNGPAFVVPSLGVSGGRHCEPNHGETAWAVSLTVNHSANVAALTDTYRTTLARFMRMQSRPYAGSVEQWLSEQRSAVLDYAACFGVDDATLPSLDVTADLAAIEERFARLDAKRADPKYSANLRRGQEMRAARKAAELAREQAARELQAAQRIEAFRNGETFGGYLRLPYALLRVKPGSDDTLQTSQYAEVPLAHARRVYSFVARCRATSTPYQRNGHTVHIGHFTIESIDAAGNLRAGCHNIQWEEIERFAQSQGWSADEPLTVESSEVQP